MPNSSDRRALRQIESAGGLVRTSRLLGLGVHPRELYRLRDSGQVREVSRGVWRLARLPALENQDLAIVALRVPNAVVCLISALDFHGLTNEIPREITIALPRGTAKPVIGYPPLRVFRVSGAAYSKGIETHDLGGVKVRVYGAAKTIADCFKFRNKIGIDVAVDALRTALATGKVRPADIVPHARTCRVDRVMRPYFEALT